MVEGHPRNISVNYSKICAAVLEKKLFKAKADDGRTNTRMMDDGLRPITIAHLEYFVLR